MTSYTTVALFPGQGAYYRGALNQAYHVYPAVAQTLAEVDVVAHERLNASLSQLLLQADPPAIDELLATDPELLQLAIYGVSVAAYRVLQAHGFKPDVLVGHSFGEIAALVASGAFSVRDGAEIICHRVAALKRFGTADGYMAALGVDARRSAMILELVGDSKAVVAVENHDSQTVISGTRTALDTARAVAHALNTSFIKLNSPYPFHSPLVEPAAQAFALSLRHIPQQQLQIPVYSPILGRLYDETDILADRLAEHLHRPVRFAQAVTALAAAGAQLFVECGALDTLGRVVSRITDAGTTTIACLLPGKDEIETLRAAVQTLTDRGAIAPSPVDTPALLLPGIDERTRTAFWRQNASRIAEYVRSEFELFRRNQEHEPTVRQPVTHEPKQTLNGHTSDEPSHVAPDRPSRDAIFGELTAMYASALEYPEEVFGDDVPLEAELGIDSVKQTELLARVVERYGLPKAPEDFQVARYDTLGKVADFVHAVLENL
jgi:acyl transferase domain-containing protein